MLSRIRQIIEYYGLNTSQFEKKISVSNGTIRSAMARNNGLNSDVLIKILEVYHEISPDWLLLGKGKMLLNSGVEMEIVSKVLGHSSTRMTRQIYAKLLDETVADAMSKVDLFTT